MDFEKLLKILNFPINIGKAVRNKIIKDEIKIQEISKTAYQGENFEFELCKRMPITRLAVVTYLLLEKYDEYKLKGIPDEIIFDSFRDVSLRATYYFLDTGKIGITKDDVVWFRHIMNVNIFKIGSIQFQPFEMIYLDEETLGEPYMEFSNEQKKNIPAGTPVINCHIQRGADLNSQKLDLSFEFAKQLFGKIYPDKEHKVFLCYSWLLYPRMVKSLPDNSKIKQFAERFKIISECDDSDQAMECLRKNSDSLLCKMAKENKELFGFACGIIEIN